MKKIETVLIVDDDIDDREIFMEAVGTISSSIACITAIDGEDALKKLNRAEITIPDMIFLDLNMPKMDGRQFLVELKRSARFNDIPVVIYSTSFLKRDMDETRQLGASHFLAKPSDFHELCDSLGTLISAGSHR